MEGLPIQGILKYTGHFSGLKSGELSDFLGDLSVDNVFGLALSSDIFLIRSISPLSLRLVQIIGARCTNVNIRLIVCLFCSHIMFSIMFISYVTSVIFGSLNSF